jgi:DNA-binding Lrp family transcriptional regulator
MTRRKNPFTPFDATDYEIIKLLQKNARASASEIARAVDMNERTVRKRIDRLLDLGIGRVTLVLEPQVFSYGISVDIFLEIDQNKEDEILETLLSMPAISYLAFSQDTNELSLEARFKSNEELYQFLRRTLPDIDGVTVKEYTLVPRIVKNIDEWLPHPEDFGIPE